MSFIEALAPINGFLNATAALLRPRGPKYVIVSPHNNGVTGGRFEDVLRDGISGPAGTSPSAQAPKQAAELIALYDADGDGRLTRAELGMSEQAFHGADANGDGFVDHEELVNVLTRTTGKPATPATG